MNDIKEINNNLLAFWNQAQKLTDEYKKSLESVEVTYQELAPAEKLYQAVASLNNCKNVLDYGCGNAWAAIIANKEGCEKVTAVDVGENIIESANFFNKLFDARVNAFSIDTNWLTTVKSETYDGLICSNVLDVVPLEIAKEIIKQFARVLCKNAKAIIGLNFYMSEEGAKQRNMELIEGRYLFVNGVLRLSSLTDQEWKDLFVPYFDVKSLDYFAWPGEEKETRRLFCLIKR